MVRPGAEGEQPRSSTLCTHLYIVYVVIYTSVTDCMLYSPTRRGLFATGAARSPEKCVFFTETPSGGFSLIHFLHLFTQASGSFWPAV